MAGETHWSRPWVVGRGTLSCDFKDVVVWEIWVKDTLGILAYFYKFYKPNILKV